MYDLQQVKMGEIKLVCTYMGGMGWEVGGRFKREGNICIPVVDSCSCVAETNAAL